MKLFVPLFLTLCVGVALADVDTSECRPLDNLASFNFFDFIGDQYKYEAITTFSKLKTIASAYFNSLQVGDNYYTIFTVNYKDGTQEDRTFLISEHEKSVFHQVEIINGDVSPQENLVYVYAYVQDSYVALYICGEKTDSGNDLRIVLSKGNYRMTQSDWRKISSRDENQHFDGTLVRLGTGSRVADDAE